ncbi:transposase, partial [Azotobacter chroococcum]
MQRRSYSKAFKAQVVQECSLPGNSVASVALSHGINTHVVHRWRRHGRMFPVDRDTARLSPGGAGAASSISGFQPGGDPHRDSPSPHDLDRALAGDGRRRLCPVRARDPAMIRVDRIWLATEPLDMRAGTETALARVVAVFGAAKPHNACLSVRQQT